MNPEQKLELLKSTLSLGVSLATIALGWFVGSNITFRWNIRQKERELELNLHQKQRELDLASAREFHRLYGEFFVCWKLWNHALDGTGPEDESIRREVLLRACAAEGAVESLLVQIVSTRDLVDEDMERLGRFRQAYQTLRESMVKNRQIDWPWDSHPGYLDLKHGAMAISRLIISDAPSDQSLVRRRAKALEVITSNRWEPAKQGLGI